MARKRIKTLAHEWAVPLEDVLASCARLRLPHAHSESSLLSQEETDRVRADLDEQTHRETLMRRETVVETSAGKVVEKRLNATVMRRRHAEPDPGQATAAPAEPFHFEVDSLARDDAFEAPIFEEPPLPEIELPEPALEAPAPIDAHEANGHAGAADAPPEPAAVAAPADAAPAMPVGEVAPAPSGAEVEAAPPAAIAPAAAARTPVAKPPPARHGQRPTPPPPAPGAFRPGGMPVGRALRESAPVRNLAPGSSASQARRFDSGTNENSDPGRTINLTGSVHASAPSLDDGQRGPKVLGKIDLRKPATPAPRPATTMTPSRPGGPPRPAVGGRFGAASQPQPPGFGGGPPPPDSAKPGAARTIKKKRVVKKGPTDVAAEREMRGLRVPKKRRALPGKEQRKTEITTPKASKRVVRITEGVTVADFAHNMGVKAGEIIRKLMDMGVMSTLNQTLDVDTATLIASEFGYSVENVGFDAESAIEEREDVVPGVAVTRPPVVTIMGHVDHGKTSLLDAIRHTNVTEREFGGITQHIGAYMVEINNRKISFVDTPGHEAFTAMRARGAKVTDIVVLVVAADEGIMPQTIEALNHAKAASVPIIVAINKIDRPEANIDRVKQQLTERGLVPEDYGGETIVVPVSARTREGVDRLLEMILLQADVMELKANPDRTARGTVVESQLDRGRGPVATVLIQEGTLHQGDPFVCGITFGRVRAMQNHLGQRVTEAGPSTPVEIFGLSSVPEPGTAFTAVAEESKARQVAEFRRSKQREGGLQKNSRISLESLSERMAAGEVKELRVVIKGDVNGSVEALAESLARLSTAEVKLELIHKSVGAISETDVTLASASKAIVIGFNVRPEPKAAQLAEKEGVEVRLYTIIYEAINDMHEAMEGLLAPTYREKSIGRAEIRKTFMVQSTTVGGAMVVDGKILRSARSRLVRDGRVVWEGKIGSLRRFKDDAREVLAGYECGIGLENFNDLKPGDVIENFELEAVLRKLQSPGKPEPVRGGGAAVEKQMQT
ncbi:MAG TPA: translation initiation factor IF-2 [Candidatus Binataceae bacterium]|nr:translation initiation factor IF-2 [Candidatus Binataceae bacterium]